MAYIKAGLAVTETVLTFFVPGGAVVAAGIALAEFCIGDYVYSQFIDPTYEQ